MGSKQLEKLVAQAAAEAEVRLKPSYASQVAEDIAIDQVAKEMAKEFMAEWGSKLSDADQRELAALGLADMVDRHMASTKPKKIAKKKKATKRRR